MSGNHEKASSYDFDLPEGSIAFYPPQKREESRLMVLNRNTGSVSHHIFRDLPGLLRKGDVIVVNESRVVPARLYGKTENGGKVELLAVERDAEGHVKGLVRGLKKLRKGAGVDFGNRLTGIFTGRDGDMGVFNMNMAEEEFDRWLKKHGCVPLPPYIARAEEPLDRERYQTVFAKRDGSCAAPTAGLHFTEELLETLSTGGMDILKVCLHVGPGTFRPVPEEDISTHRLDAEYAEVPQDTYERLIEAKREGRRIIAVGTTATRALETAAMKGHGFSGKTGIFIRSGFAFRMVDALLTNFHLPRSSLLILACAFAGKERLLAAYGEAVKAGYRFYSYGDAMLIE